MKKVLIRLPNWLGDTVMSLPLIQGLTENKDLLIGLSGPEECLEILRNEKRIDIFIPLIPHRSFWKQTLWRDEVLGWKADSIIILPTSLSSALLSWWAKIPERIGYASEGRGYLLTSSLPYDEKSYRRLHLTRSYKELGKLMLYKHIDFPENPVFSESSPANFNKDSPILIFPGATYGSAKRWDITNYVEITKLIRQVSNRKILILGKDNEVVIENFEWASGTFLMLGKTTIRQLIDYIKESFLVIGSDSGPVHLSAAYLKNTVALFGSSSTAWTAPLGSRVRIVKSDVHCSPCFKPACHKRVCWESLTISRVWEKVKEIIEDS
ncbi:MAG: lipopolysaccharide heptosyltransferase II [Candidatus Coatesbacteria bacterium]|nr:lipopolysaccharide heptosyltransferase II [Candidatus Coatesbacteria bacterium]